MSTPPPKKERVFRLVFAIFFEMASVFTGVQKAGKPEKISPASTFISLVEYNPREETMDITFKSGTKYRYLNVGTSTYFSFKSSPTFDSFYSRAIKGNIQSVKLVDAGIGRQKSSPLKKVTDRRTLDEGLKREERRNQESGTVARALNAAGQ